MGAWPMAGWSKQLTESQQARGH